VSSAAVCWAAGFTRRCWCGRRIRRCVEIGGAGLAAQAIELGLVDELRMFRHPVVVGGGTPFLPPVSEDVALDLIETRTFGSRVIYERYRRARDDSD
jgi:dihydrofolate reductase